MARWSAAVLAVVAAVSMPSMGEALTDKTVECTKATCVATDPGFLATPDLMKVELSCGGTGDTINKVYQAVYGVLDPGATGCPEENDDKFNPDEVNLPTVTDCVADEELLKAFVLEQCEGEEECTVDLAGTSFEFPECAGQDRTLTVHVGCDAAFDVFNLMIQGVIVVIGFGMGATIELTVLKEVFTTHKRGLIIGVCAQFGYMPLISFMFAQFLNIPPEMALGLIVVGSSPGGVTSNLVTYWAKGSTALSVAMSAVSTLAALFMMPLLIFVYVEKALGISQDVTIPFIDIFVTLLLVVIPAGLGVFVRYRSAKWAGIAEKVGSVLGALFILAALVIGLIQNTELINPTSYPNLWIAASLLQPIGTFLGYMTAKLARLPHAERRAVCIECGLQNYTLAIGVLALSFSDDACSLVNVLAYPLIATFMYLINSLWIMLFLRYVLAPRDPNLSAVEAENREVMDHHYHHDDATVLAK